MSVAVLINLHARRGSESTAELVRKILPEARVALTRSLDEARRWLSDELLPRPPRVLLAGGGDGTAVSLVTEMRAHGLRVGAFGVLPLGTGNAWANELRTPEARRAMQGIAALGEASPPVRDFSMIEVEGRLTPFAGSGWDADIVADYQTLVSTNDRTSDVKGGKLGYVRSIVTRTVPRQMRGDGPPNVRLVSLDDEPLVIDPAGRPQRIAGAGYGSVLYEGPASVAGAGTTSELGLHAKIFPFVNLVPGKMEVRIYAASALEGALNMLRIWKGVHPLPKDHHWLLSRCRMEYDREVPVEIGGDVIGSRRSIEYGVSTTSVPMIDWAALARPRLAAATA